MLQCTLALLVVLLAVLLQLAVLLLLVLAVLVLAVLLLAVRRADQHEPNWQGGRIVKHQVGRMVL